MIGPKKTSFDLVQFDPLACLAQSQEHLQQSDFVKRGYGLSILSHQDLSQVLYIGGEIKDLFLSVQAA
jgi:hypothetical protein